jgi:hypothetical protein
MKLPAVAIAALFTGGIALGLYPRVAEHASSRSFLLILFALVFVCLLVGVVLTKFNRLFPAIVVSSLSWILFGVAGACISLQPRPSNCVLSLAETGRIDLKSPLRWHGRLQDEPAKLPWGYGYVLGLTGVESQGELISVSGGLRMSFTTHPDQPLPPDVHTGDAVTALTQAKRPQVFRDDGALLAVVQPNIAIISSGEDNPYGHPSPELLERLEAAKVQILRTDRDGAVHILTDGKTLAISCFVACLETVNSEPQ